MPPTSLNPFEWLGCRNDASVRMRSTHSLRDAHGEVVASGAVTQSGSKRRRGEAEANIGLADCDDVVAE